MPRLPLDEKYMVIGVRAEAHQGTCRTLYDVNDEPRVTIVSIPVRQYTIFGLAIRAQEDAYDAARARQIARGRLVKATVPSLLLAASACRVLGRPIRHPVALAALDSVGIVWPDDLPPCSAGSKLGGPLTVRPRVQDGLPRLGAVTRRDLLSAFDAALKLDYSAQDLVGLLHVLLAEWK